MYELVRAYNDCTSMSEHSDDIVALLEAAAIYLRDRSCWSLHIYDNKHDCIVLTYYREV